MRQTQLQVFNKRTRIVFWAMGFLTIIFGLRLYQLQIIHGESYRNQADQQYTTSSSSEFNRGSIFFGTKENQQVPAASTKHGIKVAITPNTISNPNQLYNSINKVVEIEKEPFLKKANKSDDPYEEILFRLDKETANKIRELDSSDLRFHRESWRVYPQNEMAAQTIGFVSYADDKLRGQYGLERQYEDVLKRDSHEKKNLFVDILTSLSRSLSPSWFNQGDLMTTLDLSSQRELLEIIGNVQNKWNSEQTGGIIINPKTGAVVAMESLPSFNPNKRSSEDTFFFKNPIVENLFEMGSIVKPLIVASALDSNSISPSFSYEDKGSIEVQDKVIFNFDKKGRGPNTTLETILSDSLNTGMVLIEQKMGHKKTKDYLEKLKIRDKTGIDLPNEARGLTSNLDTLGDVEYANIAFGQGLALSPISVTTALSSLANDGKLPVPHLGNFVSYPEGSQKTLSPNIEEFSQIFKPETVKQVSELLVSSVDNVLGGGKYKNEHYSIAAKTGTAQIPNLTEGGYYSDRNLHTFFGYFPASNPNFLVFLYTLHPKEVKFSSQTLAEPFFSLANFLINYYHIPPDR